MFRLVSVMGSRRKKVRRGGEGRGVVAAVLAWADKHSASVQAHSSTGAAGKEEEEGEDLNIEPVPFSPTAD